MADLDDFFAKKDKKKGKSKKFLSSDELVKQLSEQAAKEKELKKPAKIDEESEPNPQNQESEDEWKEFVEENRRPDLSNLKLGQLTIGEDNNNQNSTGNDYENENYQFDGDNAENPWNKQSSTATPAPTPGRQEPAPKPTGAYVPPSMARAEGAQRARMNKKNAPDLENKDSFPTLGTEKAEPPKIWKRDGFEEVKHGSKHQQAAAGQAPVSTANNWSLLRESVDS